MKVVIAFIFSKLLLHGLFVFVEINLAKFAESGDLAAQNCSFETEIDSCSINQIENESIQKSYVFYSCLLAGTFFLGIIVSVVFYQLIIVATRNVHDIALAGLFKSPMRFFNINSPGRLLNRFAQGIRYRIMF